MVVVDASALVAWLLRTSAGFRVAHRVLASGDSLHAPELIFPEVASAFRRMVSHGTITQDLAEDGLRDLVNFRLRAYPHLSLLGRVWELRNSVSAYDATYLALAERLKVSLLTCDQRLGAAHGHRVKVEVF